jgi:hypothetical protein
MDNTENSAAEFKDSATSVLTPKPRKRYIKDFVRIWIEKKRKNPRQIKLLSDIHYDLVKPLAEAGFDIDKLSPKQKKRRRETITVRYPKDICDELGITRASIGLYTGDVAHMYFRGNRHSINIAEIPKLQHKGTDILVIEKEGIAERLRHYAAKSEDEKKEELQHTIQTNVEELGGGGEGSLITGPEEIPITEPRRKRKGW